MFLNILKFSASNVLSIGFEVVIFSFAQVNRKHKYALLISHCYVHAQHYRQNGADSETIYFHDFCAVSKIKVIRLLASGVFLACFFFFFFYQ